MTLAAPNEPTEGEGGLEVRDAEGDLIGWTTADVPVPSEDLARVAIRLARAVRDRLDLDDDVVDVEATWLERVDHTPPLLILTKPLGEALREEGFAV